MSNLAAQRPSSSANDSSTIVTLEHEWLDANDSATLERILAPDFRHEISSGRAITKAEHIRFVTTHPRPVSMHPHFARLDVRIYGDAAIAEGSVAAIDTTGHELARNVFTDVFIKRAGTWRAVSAQETDVASTPPKRLGTPPRH